MSVKMMTMVFERFPYGGNERVLALALADNANEYGEHIYPGNKTLSKKCLMSERTVVRMLQKFIDIGWLVKVSQGNKRMGQANEYRISSQWVLGQDLKLLGDKLSPIVLDNQVTNESTLSDKSPHDQVTKPQLLGDTAMSPQRHIQHNNNVITTPRAKEPSTEIQPMRPEAALACRLIPLGVAVTSMHPTLCKWIADKIPLDFIEQCLAIARQNKPLPEKIAANYLDSIIRSEMRPKKPDKKWMMSDATIDSKARELGVTCPPRITSYRDFADYLVEIEQKLKQQKAA